MRHEELVLPEDPATAVQVCREASCKAPVVVFKKSPTCPVSHHALAEFHAWLEGRDEAAPPVQVVEIDVLARKPLARGLVAELGITHESPQALLFAGGEVRWHASHAELTRDRFASEVSRLQEL